MMDPADIGTRFDPPATDVQLGADGTTEDQPTLFALLKGILLQLIALNERK